MKQFDELGREVPDRTPVEVPLSARRPESMQDTIARMVSLKMSEAAQAQGLPSFEEEDDFEDPSEVLDEQLVSPYTVNEVPMQSIGAENDLEGAQAHESSGRGPTGDDPTNAAQGPSDGPESEVPQ